MESLYEINQTYMAFLDQIASGDIPEEAIADTLEALDGEFDDKADGIACYIKSLLSEAQAIKTEQDALAERAATKKRKAESLQNYLYQQFKLRGKTKLETPRNLLKIRKNPPSVLIDDEAAFIAWAKTRKDTDMLTVKDPIINKTSVKNALKAGAEVPHAQLVAGEKLSIK